MHPRVILQTHVGTVEVKRIPARQGDEHATERYAVVCIDGTRKGIVASFGKPEDALRWCASQRRQDGTLIFENAGVAPETETAVMLGKAPKTETVVMLGDTILAD